MKKTLLTLLLATFLMPLIAQDDTTSTETDDKKSEKVRGLGS